MKETRRQSSCSSCGEQIRSDSVCSCHRLQKALKAQSERLEWNAGVLFARLRWAHLRKVTPSEGFGGELNGLRTELENLAHNSCEVYAKLARANRKIVGFHFIHWVRQKTKEDLSKVLNEHFNPWIHDTLYQNKQDTGAWLAPRWLREHMPGGEEQDEPESMLDQAQTVEVLDDIRFWIEELNDAALDIHLDEIQFETEIADACAPQILDANAKGVTNPAVEFEHSDDYRSVLFEGRSYVLTRNQATIVRILHEAYLRGMPEVANEKLLEGIESETSRVRDSFKGSPLWGTLVVKGSKKSFFRLNLPETRG